MLTPKQLQEIVETMQPVLDDLNGWITRDIVRRVMARLGRGEQLELTASDQWQAQTYIDAGGHLEDLQRVLMAYTQAADEEIRRIFQYAGLVSYEADAEILRRGGRDVPVLRQSPRMQQLLEDTYRRTNNELNNFTRTTANESQKAFIRSLDAAHMKVVSSATSYTTAVREIVEDLADQQATVRYPTGHQDTLEVATLRAVRTGTAQATGNMTIMMMDQYDWDIVLTSAHIGARYGDGGENPGNHYWWQGRFFSRSGRDKRFPPFIESTGYGTGEGLCGWNCRHSFGPGDGEHNPWEHFDEEENKRIYDLSQEQRRQERNIRKQKKKVMALKEAVDNCSSPAMKRELQEAYTAEYDKLGRQNGTYNQFCEDNDLRRMPDRLEVAKWNYRQMQKAYKDATPKPRTTSGTTAVAAPASAAPSTAPAPATPEPTPAPQAQPQPVQHFKEVPVREWYPNAKPGSHEVQDLQQYTVGDQTYTVHGKDVVLDYKPHEKEIAEMLARDVGGETYMVPRVNNPQGVSTPDIMFNGHSYDLKTIRPGATENTIFNRVYKGIRQADRFIIDITDSGLSDETVDSQVKKIFWSRNTETVTEIVIVKNGHIEKVLKRN